MLQRAIPCYAYARAETAVAGCTSCNVTLPNLRVYIPLANMSIILEEIRSPTSERVHLPIPSPTLRLRRRASVLQVIKTTDFLHAPVIVYILAHHACVYIDIEFR